jgi:hypothetical protein
MVKDIGAMSARDEVLGALAYCRRAQSIHVEGASGAARRCQSMATVVCMANVEFEQDKVAMLARSSRATLVAEAG